MPIIAILILLVPIAIAPGILFNAFEKPKSALILAGACILAMMALRNFKRIDSKIEKILLLLVALNVLSFFYTQNPYYTRVAVTLNLSCLMILWYVAAYSTPAWNERLLMCISISGGLVSVVAILQAYGIYWPIPWLNVGASVGTIGNSNYLGAYLVFPFFASLYLTFKKGGMKWQVLNGKLHKIFLIR